MTGDEKSVAARIRHDEPMIRRQAVSGSQCSGSAQIAENSLSEQRAFHLRRYAVEAPRSPPLVDLRQMARLGKGEEVACALLARLPFHADGSPNVRARNPYRR